MSLYFVISYRCSTSSPAKADARPRREPAGLQRNQGLAGSAVGPLARFVSLTPSIGFFGRNRGNKGQPDGDETAVTTVSPWTATLRMPRWRAP